MPVNVNTLSLAPVLNSGTGLGLIGGGMTVSGPSDGSRLVTQRPSGLRSGSTGVDTRATSAIAVPQTDLLNLDAVAAGASLVVDLGEVSQFFDATAAGSLALGEVLMIDPNGIPVDLFTYTVLKTSGDGFVSGLPNLPPGRYVFTNISGGALSGTTIYARHLGARNLA